MSKLKNSTSALIFVDYKPAELRQNKDWIIVYYAKISAKDEFNRLEFVKDSQGSILKEHQYNYKKLNLL
jgi:hypothetical protein